MVREITEDQENDENSDDGNTSCKIIRIIYFLILLCIQLGYQSLTHNFKNLKNSHLQTIFKILKNVRFALILEFLIDVSISILLLKSKENIEKWWLN